MIQWLKNLFGFRKPRKESKIESFSRQYGSTAAGDIVGGDKVTTIRNYPVQSVAAELLVIDSLANNPVVKVKGDDVVLSLEMSDKQVQRKLAAATSGMFDPPVQKQSKKKKKQSREARRRAKASRRG